MNQEQIVLYGNVTKSDFDFLQESIGPVSFPLSSATAESAPPELENLFSDICKNCENLARQENLQFSSEWNVPELLTAIMGQGVKIPGYLNQTYYDIILRGSNSWIFEDLKNFIDLINYSPPLV